MSEPSLLLLACLVVAVLLAGGIGILRPLRVLNITATILCGIGAALAALLLLIRAEPALLSWATAFPALTPRIEADPVNLPFLFALLLSGAVILAVRPSAPGAITVAGLALIILGAGAVPIGVGVAIASVGLWSAAPSDGPPPLVLAAPASLLWLGIASPGATPPVGLDFAAIRSLPPDGLRAALAAGLAMAAAAAMLASAWHRPPEPRTGHTNELLGTLAIAPALYLVARFLIDLPGPVAHAWCGFALLLAGVALALTQGWGAVGEPDLSRATAGLVRLHAGLALAAMGACVIARAADLPEAAAFGLSATLLFIVGTNLAGTAAMAVAALITTNAGTGRLARLGGLIRTMPMTSGILAIALAGLSALPPGVGFASLWLLFEALLHTPRTGGLFAQIPIALAAACAAAAFAMAAAATLRIAGIALLGRPRTARAAGAIDITRVPATILGATAILAGLIGLLPGLTLRALAHPLVVSQTGVDLDTRVRWTSLSPSATAPGYATLPALALVLLLAGGVILSTRRYRAQARLSTIWTDGQPAAPGLPFGDPMAQSAGTGFRPLLPRMPGSPSIQPAPETIATGWPDPARPGLPLSDPASSHAERAGPRPSSPELPDAARSGPAFGIRAWLPAPARRAGLQLKRTPRLSARVGLWAMLISLSILLLASALSGGSGP